MPQGLDYRRRFPKATPARFALSLRRPARVGSGAEVRLSAGALPAVPLDRIHGKRHAAYRPFDSGALASG